MANKTAVYDAEVIRENAKRLYRRAGSIVFSSILMGIFIGGIGGALITGLNDS